MSWLKNMKTKIIANYLPQFHRILENDRWWGEGYTDWEAVKKSIPVFRGHRQPREPLEGYYDLSKKEAIQWQAGLAKAYGIDGFGIYHYWFSSKQQLLTKPAEILLNNKDIDIEFMFIWDNGSWKRTWSRVKGPTNDWAPLFENSNSLTHNEMDKGILAELIYGDENEWKLHFDFLLPYFKDRRYIKVDNKPVFVIFHQDNNGKLLKSMFEYWNSLAVQAGFNGVFVIGQINSNGVHFADEEFKYQPQWDGWANKNLYSKIKNKLFPQNRHVYDYDDVWNKILDSAEKDKKKKINFGAFVDYDDSPRRGGNGKIFEGASPEKFRKYFERLLILSNQNNKRFIFLTAWNEWGEGAYLEPDTYIKYAYLEALKCTIDNCNGELK